MRKKIIKIDHYNSLHKDLCIVIWTLGSTCNYSCSYCDGELNNGKYKWLPVEKVLEFCDTIIKYYQKELGKKIFFQFTGGEITLNKDLITILEHVRKKECITGIISNGSKRMNYWEKLSPCLDHIMLSYHPAYDYSEHYYQLVNELNKSISVYCNIMMLPEKFSSAKKLGMEIINNNEGVIAFFEILMSNIANNHKVSPDYSDQMLKELKELYNYSKEKAKYIKDSPFRNIMQTHYADGTRDIYASGEYLLDNINIWKGWICWAGIDQIVVSSRGDVYRAWCLQDWLGNIMENNVKFPKYPVFCSQKRCHCGTDIKVRREVFSPL